MFSAMRARAALGWLGRTGGSMSRAARLALTLAALGLIAPAEPPHVESFSPEGSAKAVRQVALRFTAALAPLGDPRATGDPASLRCKPAARGEGRWVDPSSWVFDFEAPLPGATRCTLRLARGLRTLAGERISGTRRFEFDTGGPAVLAIAPAPGSRTPIEEDARFVLRLDVAPDARSVERFVHLEDVATRERTAVRIVTGAERDDLLRAVAKAPRASDLVLAPVRSLAPSSAVDLVWGRGVSANGVSNEEAQHFAYRVRDPLALEPVCGGAACNPSAGLALTFNAPIDAASAAGMRLVPLGAHAQLPARELTLNPDRWREAFEAKDPFPQLSRWRIELPPGLRDLSGRRLAAGADVVAEFGAYPPQAAFRNRLAIAEPEGAAWRLALHAAPASARLREAHVALAGLGPREQARAIDAWLRAVLAARDGDRVDLPSLAPSALVERALTPTPDAEPITQVALPIVGLGLHAAMLDGIPVVDPRGAPAPAALTHVTNFAVHLKASRGSALVWITRLRDAAPVAGARVHVFGCDRALLGRGTTDAQGIVMLSRRDTGSDCVRPQQLLVVAQLGGDVAFLHTELAAASAGDWYGLYAAHQLDPPPLVHIALARNLLRRGETLNGKLYVREATLAGFAAPPQRDLAEATTLPIVHLESGDAFEASLRFDAHGNGLFEWSVPRDAPLGFYGFEGDDTDQSFRVEDFRPPLIEGAMTMPEGAQVAPEKLLVDFALAYLSGGPAANLPIEVRTARAPKWTSPPEGLEEFAIGRGEYAPESEDDEYDDYDSDGWTPVAPWEKAQREAEEAFGVLDDGAPSEAEVALTLDAAGRGRAELPLPGLAAAEVVLVEATFRDPNGAAQTLTQRFDIWPAALQVGVASLPASEFPDALPRIEAVVLGLDGEPLAGAPVELEWVVVEDRDETRRLPGGFSLAKAQPAQVSRSPLCRGVSDARGRVACSAAAPGGDAVYVVARASDAAGRSAATHDELSTYLSHWLDSRIAFSADKDEYAPGEIARIELKTAFEAATALVTIEREGIAEHRIVALRAGASVLEVPLRASFAPNVHVAVLALAGSHGPGAPPSEPRAPDAAAGAISIAVTPSAYSLDVAVKPERDAYRPREQVRTRIQVRASDGAPLPSGGEVALAVVDEALLELAPNVSWDLAAFLREPRPRSVLAATTQPLAVERGGAEGGGLFGAPSIAAEAGGVEEIVVTASKREESIQDVPTSVSGLARAGASGARERFDSLVLWRGRVELDAQGEASLEIPLNDLLTRLRIVALATAGVDRFGAGSASIRTTQPLQIYSGVAPVAREGDRARVEFTLRNTTERALAASVRLALEGSDARFEPQQIDLAAGEAKPVAFSVSVPFGVASLGFDLTATAGDGAVDRLRVTQRVLPLAPEEVLQATILQLTGEAKLPVERPEYALPQRGGVDITLRRSLASGTEGIREFFESYPFRCLEQEASIAIGLRDPQRWQELAASLDSRLDRYGFATFFPSSEHGSDVLTAYVVSIADAAGYEIPEAPLERMLAALRAFALGRIEPRSYVGAADLVYRRLAALAAISRHEGAKPELVAALPREHPELWPTSALLDALAIETRWPGAGAPRERLLQLLRSRLVLGGTTLAFTREAEDRLDWLLAGGDANAVRLALLAQELGELDADRARLLLGALARQRGGRWETTIANAWGRLALEAFAAKHEREPVAGATRAQLGDVSAAFEWEEAGDPPKQRLAWPPAQAELALRHDGTGKPWAEIQSVAVAPQTEPRFNGFRVSRSWTPLTQRKAGRWSRGDVVRVRLELEALGSFAWVAVSDPVPPGATILGSGLGRDSALLTRGERGSRSRWECPCLENVERSFETYREFYGWAPAGQWSTEYTLRLDQAGEFSLPPTRAEAMYAPESYGSLPHEKLEVAP
jgi:uncharacterized protein YfaS (alpha-2-macroglobulin family)